mmetsp:Transcript_20582/g.22983  ORF Transcript_20582/g.22983 Transcript_20582/m.22983 type:complete len:157 (+) Transcript_20582:215-685(+)
MLCVKLHTNWFILFLFKTCRITHSLLGFLSFLFLLHYNNSLFNEGFEQPNYHTYLYKKFKKMQIFVGTNAYEVDPSTSVEALKLQIENAEFVPAGMISLMNGADTLMEGSLESNGVEEDESLEMRMAVNSGMRKKWRKKRMRRLRRKRRKMRQRAR